MAPTIAKQLKSQEKENGRLKNLVAEQTLSSRNPQRETGEPRVKEAYGR